MPLLWESSNEIYFVAGVSLLVTLAVIVSLAYFLYKRSVANGRRASEEQAALEKVLLRRESVATTSTSPPTTKPLIVSPSFSSPNKVPARHLRSGSYSPTHFLSPYHKRQSRRNSSPGPTNCPNSPSSCKQQLQLHNLLHSESNQKNCSILEEEISNNDRKGSPSRVSASSLLDSNKNAKNIQIKSASSLPHNKQQQHYGTIPPRKVIRYSSASTSEKTSPENSKEKERTSALHLNSSKKQNIITKADYIQLPGKDGLPIPPAEDDEELESCAKKDLPKISKDAPPPPKKDSNHLEEDLRRKLILQQQFQQHNQKSAKINSSGEMRTKTKQDCMQQLEIPYYISTQ